MVIVELIQMACFGWFTMLEGNERSFSATNDVRKHLMCDENGVREMMLSYRSLSAKNIFHLVDTVIVVTA